MDELKLALEAMKLEWPGRYVKTVISAERFSTGGEQYQWTVVANDPSNWFEIGTGNTFSDALTALRAKFADAAGPEAGEAVE